MSNFGISTNYRRNELQAGLNQPLFSTDRKATTDIKKQAADQANLKKIFAKIGVNEVSKPQLIAYLTANMPRSPELDTSGYVYLGLYTDNITSDYDILKNNSEIPAINMTLVKRLADKNVLRIDRDTPANIALLNQFSINMAEQNKKSYAIYGFGYATFYASLNDIADYILDGRERISIKNPGKILGNPNEI